MDASVCQTAISIDCPPLARAWAVCSRDVRGKIDICDTSYEDVPVDATDKPTLCLRCFPANYFILQRPAQDNGYKIILKNQN